VEQVLLHWWHRRGVCHAPWNEQYRRFVAGNLVNGKFRCVFYFYRRILFIDLVLFLGRVGYGASLEGMVSKISLGKTLFLLRFSVTVADLKISCSFRLF